MACTSSGSATEVYITKDDKEIFTLDSGIDSVMAFNDHIYKGALSNARKIKYFFTCNYDVELLGKDLLSFVKTNYKKSYNDLKKIIKASEVYKIISYDMS